jgi:tRNA (guanine-N7-)-methyltransferase
LAKPIDYSPAMPSRPGKVRLKTPLHRLYDAGILLTPAAGIPKPEFGLGGTAAAGLDFGQLFGNALPVEAEIGPGKGAFLIRRAKERPEVNFLAVEWVPQYAAYVADRALRAGLTNVRAVAADAEKLFAVLPDECLWRVHIYFPDPWPKTRHHRRRLIKPAFLAQVRRVLKIGGWIGVVTDHQEYFRQVRRAFDATAGLAQVEFRSSLEEGGLVDSNFQRKYAAQGKSFYSIAAIRYR